MGDISMRMVIETTRENEISPRESKYIEKRKGPTTEFGETKDERSKLRKANPQVKIGTNLPTPQEIVGRMKPSIIICLNKIYVKVLSSVQINFNNNEKATISQRLLKVG